MACKTTLCKGITQLNDEIISVDPFDDLLTDPDASELTVEQAIAVASVADHGQRLDKVLVQHWPEWSRSWLQNLIDQGEVKLAGVVVTKPSAKVKAGDMIEVRFAPTAQASAFVPQAMDLDVVFEDEHVLVLNKPAGMVVHPAAGNWSGTLLNGLLAHHEAAKHMPRAGIVHRLDKDTSGLMVVGKNQHACEHLVNQIAQRQVQRVYVALAHGVWRHAPEIEMNWRIGRDGRNRLRMAGFEAHSTQGKTALTRVRHLDGSAAYSWVTCKLHTGRTHQIRVHMLELGHPLVGDVLYGGKLVLGLQRQALHAAKLAFEHPFTHAWMTFEAPLPPDLVGALQQAGLHYNVDCLWITQQPKPN
jgi:23S rRNA pseudouridine1911/1915/1917 synthase